MDQDTTFTRHPTATRRTFLKNGAALAAPIAVASVAVPAAALASSHTNGAHAAQLENDTAIRNLHQAWLRRIDSGYRDPMLNPTVQRITADPAGDADRIELAADCRSATAQYDCLVERQTPLALDSTLAQMAHAQGHGAVNRSDRQRLSVNYTLGSNGWQIARVDLKTL